MGMGRPDLPGSGKMMEMAETIWQTRAQRTENYRPPPQMRKLIALKWRRMQFQMVPLWPLLGEMFSQPKKKSD